MRAILDSFLLVFASEMGDKTQLLALLLVARFSRPWIIMAGIFFATILNHALAASVGLWVTQFFSPNTLQWILAVVFWIFGIWILIPDKEEELKERMGFGVFTTTLVSFFLAEMGDKTQIATVALGARYTSPFYVTLGTTMGMMGADGLAVFFGKSLLSKIPMKWIRFAACILFLLFGLAIVYNSLLDLAIKAVKPA